MIGNEYVAQELADGQDSYSETVSNVSEPESPTYSNNQDYYVNENERFAEFQQR